MSTFQELSQELARLAGVPGTGPANVATATGIELRCVNYIKNAWMDIQSHPKNWKWMWGSYLAPAPGGAPLLTIIGTTNYSLTDVAQIRTKTFLTYETAVGISDRQRMGWTPYDEFIARYAVVVPTNDRPLRITREPTGDLRVYPPPDKVYSIPFEYFKDVQVLAANGDIPNMPTRFHELIVYEGLKRYGKAEDAPELIALGEQEGGSEGSEGRPSTGLWRTLIWDQQMTSDIADNEQASMVVRPE